VLNPRPLQHLSPKLLNKRNVKSVHLREKKDKRRRKSQQSVLKESIGRSLRERRKSQSAVRMLESSQSRKGRKGSGRREGNLRSKKSQRSKKDL